MKSLYRGLAPLSLALVVPALGWADELPRGHFVLPEQGDVIGEVRTIAAAEEDTLLDIARRHNLGFDEIQRANPDVSLWYPGEGTEVVLPSRFVLPDAPREGIVINLSELRLYYYPANDPGRVETYPISVGRDGFATPVGVTRTTVKVKDPAWSPPRSMREEAAARGEPAPSIVPPGPDNPLGRHAILLGLPSYLIHGTNQPDGVGMRVSRGCIRMFPEDIESLYERVPNGTQVNIIDQPFKAGWDGDTLMVQAYPALEENEASFEPVLNALEVLSRAFGDEEPPVDYAQLRQAVEQPSGQPVAVLREAEAVPALPEAEPSLEGIYEVVEVAFH
ncbi:L,D-transpeptidase family protein [Halomonas salifodinae]|uniref:L,D-transpeptidase family protein n=1 Tax=Halomonas salifodinae TaxID=438745 RepID=UPI0033ADFA17